MFITTNRLIVGLFVLLLAGAAFFATERVLFADASFILFRIINTGTLQIQEHRYGSFITQAFPLLAAWFHLPLFAIVVLYSLSFQLFYLAVVLLLVYRFREKELAILMSLYFLLFVSHTWFWMNNEVHQGIAWMFLLFGVVLFRGKKKVHPALQTTIFSLLSFLSLYTHPLLLFPVSYLWLFLSRRSEWPYTKTQTIILSAILILLVLSKLYWSSHASSHYDAEKLQGIKDLSFRSAANALISPFAAEIGIRMLTKYWIVLLLFLGGVVVLWLQRAWSLLLITVGYVLLYLIALCLTFTSFTTFYTESELMPATIILAAPFVYFILPRLHERVEVILLAIIFLLRIGSIASIAPYWIGRKDWLLHTLNIMQKQNCSKGILHEKEAEENALLLTWGIPAESLIASALQGEKPQRTFVVGKLEDLSQRLPPDNKTIIGSFEHLRYSALNPRYFSFDTTAGYRVLFTR